MRRRQLPRFRHELAPLLAQARDIERRRIDALGELARAALEPAEELFHRRERAVRREQTFFLEAFGDLGNQLPAEAGDVGERREHPHRRGAERDHAHELDAVAGCTAQQEVLAERREVRVGGLHAADVLDQELQRDVDEAAIETTATKADRQRHRRDLADGAGCKRGGRAHDALR